MAIDYEVEYNNRARVPEHPDIFAGWQRDARAYRKEAAAEGRAELGLRYGATPRQYIDLFSPKGGGASAPLALFIHGGYWRALDKRDFTFIAPPFVAAGTAVALINYDLCPKVTVETIVAPRTP